MVHKLSRASFFLPFQTLPSKIREGGQRGFPATVLEQDFQVNLPSKVFRFMGLSSNFTRFPSKQVPSRLVPKQSCWFQQGCKALRFQGSKGQSHKVSENSSDSQTTVLQSRVCRQVSSHASHSRFLSKFSIQHINSTYLS